MVKIPDLRSGHIEAHSTLITRIVNIARIETIAPTLIRNIMENKARPNIHPLKDQKPVSWDQKSVA